MPGIPSEFVWIRTTHHAILCECLTLGRPNCSVWCVVSCNVQGNLMTYFRMKNENALESRILCTIQSVPTSLSVLIQMQRRFPRQFSLLKLSLWRLLTMEIYLHPLHSCHWMITICLLSNSCDGYFNSQQWWWQMLCLFGSNWCCDWYSNRKLVIE